MENAALLKRIQTRQPTYNHLKWEEERRKNEEYLKNICEYPEGLESLKRKQQQVFGSGFNDTSYYSDEINPLSKHNNKSKKQLKLL